MKNSDETVMLHAGQEWRWRPGLMKRCYELALDTFAHVGLEPNRLGGKAPGVNSKKYGTFKGKRRYLERADFDQVENFTIAHLVPGGCFPPYESDLYWSVLRGREIIVAVLPSVLRDQLLTVSTAFRDCAADCAAQYAYCFHQQVKFGPVAHCMGATLYIRDDTRNPDLRMNTSWWGGATFGGKPCPPGLLRDIYPESYLSEPYLCARMGRSATTLKQWIEADPAHRGTLEPFTDILTRWTPPIEKIPVIREELYRAGRVFYWRFMCPEHRDPNDWSKLIPEPLFRPDPSAPWEAPDPIPEIYRAEYWRDKDPGLTY